MRAADSLAAAALAAARGYLDAEVPRLIERALVPLREQIAALPTGVHSARN